MTGWLVLAALGAAIPVVAWIGYPWLMIRLGERRPAAAVPPGAPISIVSVVIATREPPEAVRARLEDLVSGSWPADRLELIVAVDGDPVPYQFEDLSPAAGRLAVVSRGAEPGKAAALNAGVAASTGDLVVFADTAQRFAPDAIRRLVEALGDPRFGAVSGALALGNEADSGSPIVWYWRLEKRLRAAEARFHSTIGVTGAIYAMRRALWAPLPPGLILDDLWIPMRLVLAGHRVGFEPRAVASDTRTTSAAQEYQRKVRTLTGNLQLMAWMPTVLLPGRNPVWLQFWFHKLLRLATPWALLACFAGVIGAGFSASRTLGWGLVGTGAASAVLLAAVPGAPGRRARGALGWMVAMQGAILAATWNGLRGRWNVWQH
jgi:cellulose synthase/poly-beta-1,6-N-acetylglucosamine synthase-like glycosyltransferase